MLKSGGWCGAQLLRKLTLGPHLHSKVASTISSRPGRGPGQTPAALGSSAHDHLMSWLKIVQPWTLSLLLRGVAGRGGQDRVDELGEPSGPNCASMTQFSRQVISVEGGFLEFGDQRLTYFSPDPSHEMGMFHLGELLFPQFY